MGAGQNQVAAVLGVVGTRVALSFLSIGQSHTSSRRNKLLAQYSLRRECRWVWVRTWREGQALYVLQRLSGC